MGAVEVWVIVVAGGRGSRFGTEKQYALLGDRQVLAWSVDRARSAVAAWASVPETIRPGVGPAPSDAAATLVRARGGGSGRSAKPDKGDAGRWGPAGPGGGGVVLVVPTHRLGHGSFGADVVVAGGSSRSGSVRAGLAEIPPSAEVIVVHDAARPLASPALFAAVVGAVLDGADAAVPGLEVTDTIRRRGGGTVDRSDLLRVQTPQAFRARALRDAHRDPADATDDATLVELAGGTVEVVPGEATNIKLTEPTDLAVAEVLLRLTAGAEKSDPVAALAPPAAQSPDAARPGPGALPTGQKP